ncbi:pilin [Lonepinella sp. BR2271]|uniref:pilin n=1 Tax=Lonepinella sp. BR2271 TaxID=3434550 RepID=UPI003F6DB7D5
MKIHRTFNHAIQSFSFKKGFTLIELMIVIAIVAILATIAIPSYQNYTKKAAISELLQAAAPYRSEVELCVYNIGKPEGCSAGTNGIQAALTSGLGKYVSSIAVSDGKITVSGKGSVSDVSYSLTAAGSNTAGVTWAADCGTNKELFPSGFCN